MAVQLEVESSEEDGDVMTTSQTSKKAQETLSLDCSELVQEAKPLPNDDHSYALPSSHDDLRARLREALARVESLKRERRNAQDREKRAKNTVSGLLQDLRVKKLINEELKEQLDIYSVTGEKVFVMMDACHMLKLARNMLQAYSPLTSTSGQINWKYIIHLNDVQKKDRLHAANRVTDKHVDFDSQKMVSLAAQTLSRSVTVALRTLRDLGYSQFQHCEATAEFIETSPMSDKWEPTVHIVDLLLPCGYLPVKESSKTVKKPVTRRPGAHAHPAVEKEDSSAEEDDELIPVYLSPPVSTVCENPVQPDLSMNNVQDT
ncbi:hypothetical protein PAMA_017000 [Pampus argenteus]